MDFLFTVRLGNPKEDLQNYSREQWSLLIMRARARPLFLRTVFQILFRISQSNGKNEKTDISASKSIFAFDCKSEILILKSKSRLPNRTHPNLTEICEG